MPAATFPRSTPASCRCCGSANGPNARATDLQHQLRAAHQHLGVPPLDYVIAAIAEDHAATILHYDADFERLATHTDLAATVDLLAPLGSLP